MKYYPGDQFIWKEHIKILPADRICIPGLHMIGYAKYKSACNSLETHWHDKMEIVVTLEGKHQFYVGEECYSLVGGDIFASFPGEYHGNKGILQNISEYVWFQIDLSPEFKDRFLGLAQPYSQFVYRQFAKYCDRMKTADPGELWLLREAFALISAEETQKKVLGYSYFLQFVIKNICGEEVEDDQMPRDPGIERAVSYIHEYFTEDVNIEILGRLASLSASRFQEKFKEEMGMTPHAYIMSLRLDAAKKRLKDTNCSVTEIAHELNFSTSNHFANVFRKHVGCTPTEYRKKTDI